MHFAWYRRKTLEACQCCRVIFSWQSHTLSRALSALMAGVDFSEVLTVQLRRISVAGLREHVTMPKVVAGATSCHCLQNDQRFVKNISFPNSNSFGVFSGADPSWAAKRFRGRFHQGPTEVPPRVLQGSTKVHMSWCLWFFGADPS